MCKFHTEYFGNRIIHALIPYWRALYIELSPFFHKYTGEKSSYHTTEIDINCSLLMLYTDQIYGVTKRHFIESRNFGALALIIFLHFSRMTAINKVFYLSILFQMQIINQNHFTKHGMGFRKECTVKLTTTAWHRKSKIRLFWPIKTQYLSTIFLMQDIPRNLSWLHYLFMYCISWWRRKNFFFLWCDGCHQQRFCLSQFSFICRLLYPKPFCNTQNRIEKEKLNRQP